ncbi:uncharacterized protein LOC111624141 [Centruroides sculpturatus]|uniref:uncharacterized protein LOC111624141 n=1 Tax=Centruroides sculpturatus TaxID=218467 RepID=UPI000C6DD938|nr:uncharacterized protein LOC111624141 [Centruroides sculpturatus]
MDQKLNWTDHVHYVYEKATKTAQALKTICRNRWGYGPLTSRTLYIAAIEPIITYGAEIWGSAATRVHIRRKLLSIQRLLGINAAKAYKTAPTEALLVINRTLPIDLKVKEIFLKYNLDKVAKKETSLEHFNNIIAKEKHCEDINSLAELLISNGFDKHYDYYPIHPSFVPSYSLDNSYNENHNIHIYTDGSKAPEGVGCAVVIYKDQQCLYQACRKLAPHCTNNQAESLAIYLAIDWILSNQHNWKNHSYGIFSDSRIAIQQIIKLNSTLPIVNDSIRKLQELTALNIRVDFHWIKGHSGITGNERADLLARKARTLASTTSYTGISKNYVKNEIHKIILKLWQSRWDNGDTGRLTHSFFPSPTDSMHDPRYTTFQLTQLLTGHGNLNSYLKRFLNKTDGQCNCDLKEEEEPVHVIFHCPFHITHRKKLAETVQANGLNWPCTLKDFTIDKNNFKALKKFAADIKKLD